jgi:hypothetical protein
VFPLSKSVSELQPSTIIAVTLTAPNEATHCGDPSGKKLPIERVDRPRHRPFERIAVEPGRCGVLSTTSSGGALRSTRMVHEAPMSAHEAKVLGALSGAQQHPCLVHDGRFSKQRAQSRSLPALIEPNHPAQLEQQRL